MKFSRVQGILIPLFVVFITSTVLAEDNLAKEAHDQASGSTAMDKQIHGEKISNKKTAEEVNIVERSATGDMLFLNPTTGRRSIMFSDVYREALDATLRSPLSVRSVTWALTEPAVHEGLMAADRFASDSLKNLYMAERDYHERIYNQPDASNRIAIHYGCIKNVMAMGAGKTFVEALHTCGGGYSHEEPSAGVAFNGAATNPLAREPENMMDDPNNQPEDGATPTEEKTRTSIALRLARHIDNPADFNRYVCEFRARFGDTIITYNSLYESGTGDINYDPLNVPPELQEGASWEPETQDYYPDSTGATELGFNAGSCSSFGLPFRPLEAMVHVQAVDVYQTLAFLLWNKCDYDTGLKSDTSSSGYNTLVKYGDSNSLGNADSGALSSSPLFRDMYPERGLPDEEDSWERSSLIDHSSPATFERAMSYLSTAGGAVSFSYKDLMNFYELFLEDQANESAPNCDQAFDLIPGYDANRPELSLLDENGQMKTGLVGGTIQVTVRHQLAYAYAENVAKLQLLDAVGLAIDHVSKVTGLMRDEYTQKKAISLIVSHVAGATLNNFGAVIQDKRQALVRNVDKILKQLSEHAEGMGAAVSLGEKMGSGSNTASSFTSGQGG